VGNVPPWSLGGGRVAALNVRRFLCNQALSVTWQLLSLRAPGLRREAPSRSSVAKLGRENVSPPLVGNIDDGNVAQADIDAGPQLRSR
jgi:hypothetical protein